MMNKTINKKIDKIKELCNDFFQDDLIPLIFSAIIKNVQNPLIPLGYVPWFKTIDIFHI